MWDDLHDRFSIGNGPRIHELTSHLSKCTQNGQSIVVCFGELRKLWDELAGYSKVPACTCAAATELTKEREEAKVHTFLVGLDSKLFSNLVSNLLMMEPLPSLSTAFAKAVAEERHYALARAQESSPDVIGFAAQGASKGRNSGRSNDRVKSNEMCGHCGKTRHEKDSCFEIIGYPDWVYSENKVNNSQGRGGGRTGRRGGRDRGGRGQLANAAAASSSKGSPQAMVQDSDRNGLPDSQMINRGLS